MHLALILRVLGCVQRIAQEFRMPVDLLMTTAALVFAGFCLVRCVCLLLKAPERDYLPE